MWTTLENMGDRRTTTRTWESRTCAGLGSQGLHRSHGVHDDALGELGPRWRLTVHSDDVPQARD